jgi:hypothetical protein
MFRNLLELLILISKTYLRMIILRVLCINTVNQVIILLQVEEMLLQFNKYKHQLSNNIKLLLRKTI